jgi:hypothetical protein
MQSVGQSQYTNYKQPALVGSFDYAYYFYFKGVSPLERSLSGTRKS